MPSGASQRYGPRDPHWYREPDFQAATGLNPLGSWITSLLGGGRTSTDPSQNRDRAGNTAPLQSFHKTAGLGAVVNHRDDVTRSAAQHTKKPWGHL